MTKKKNQIESKGIVDHTIKILRQSGKMLLVASILFGLLYTFLYGLWLIPVIGFGFHRMSEVTLLDGLYLLLITLMSGSLATLMRYKLNSVKTTGISGVGGVVAGFGAAACPVCQGVTLAALGGNIAFLSFGGLSPFIWVFQLVAVFVLWISLYFTANTIYTNTCITCNVPSKKSASDSKKKETSLLDNNLFLGGITIVVALVVLNQVLISTTGFVSGGSGFVGEIKLTDGFKYGPKTTLKPIPLATGEAPRIAGYKAIVKPLPTISELLIKPSTGDVAQDLVNNIIPTGTPWYGAETGVSFDDPVTSQNLWGNARALELTPEQEARWGRIVNSFTCDYCCGSPQQPTIITRCGCAHSLGAQGMAKWFIKYYGDKYSDEEIYGEMARWYALWYPGPTIQRIVLEMSTGN